MSLDLSIATSPVRVSTLVRAATPLAGTFFVVDFFTGIKAGIVETGAVVLS
jgi:hypothetical protein